MSRRWTEEPHSRRVQFESEACLQALACSFSLFRFAPQNCLLLSLEGLQPLHVGRRLQPLQPQAATVRPAVSTLPRWE